MGNSTGRRRRFGAVRELKSGRWQARYRGPDGIMRPADRTFASKTAAEVWLTRTEAEILNDEWINPDSGRVPFAEYAVAWIDERPNLRPKTVRPYRYLLRAHLQPAFGALTVAEVKEAHVRRLRRRLLDDGVSTVKAAKAYRLLKAILKAALRRGDIDLEACTVRVDRQLTETISGAPSFGSPKSDAGVRLVPFRDVIAADLRWHLNCFAQDGDDGLVFTSPAGTQLRHSNFYRRAWLKAVEAAGLSGVHFHDLRHTGNALTADAGASLRELMERMGHSSARAALIYLHSTSERQRKLADAVGRQARAELGKVRNPEAADSPSGTKAARRREPAS
jgi:integrase